MALITDTVAIPVVSGINVNTPARLLEPSQLLEATNVRFPAGAGAKKRRGHSGQRVRGAKSIPAGWTPPSFTAPSRLSTYSTDDRALPADWLYGFGYTASVTRTPDVALETSEYPEDGLCFGAASRDSEALAWSGHRLFSRTTLDVPGAKFTELNAAMPVLHAEPIAKDNLAQRTPDCADNGVIRVACWINSGVAYYSVVDSNNGTTIVQPTALVTGTATYLRCVPIGPWIHIAIYDTSADQLALRSLHQDSPGTIQSRNLGDCNGAFDIWKYSDDLFWITHATDTEIRVRGHTTDSSIAFNWLASVGTPTLISSVAICMEPSGTYLGLVWRADGAVSARVYEPLVGGTAGAIQSLGVVTTAARAVAVAPKYSPDSPLFNAYWDDSSSGNVSTTIRRFDADNVYYTASRYHHLLGSQAFRVGDRTFIWAGHNSDYQSKWLLLDEELLPVGGLDYASANTPTASDLPTLASVNWWGTAAAKDRLVYHCGLSNRVRVAVEPDTVGVNPPPVYTEPYIHFVKLDFLAPLRSAQAGRSTYFAGAQLWAYDGNELTEAGFHYAPENVTVEQAASGDLEEEGQYIWRVDLCYRNAQNEEIRSASFYTDPLTLDPGNNTATLTIPTVITHRENAYFLIFRNASTGTVWRLCNSRDPSSALFLRNDQTAASVSFTDSTVSDAELESRELHPNQDFNYLDPFSAPACEVITAGRDRLWVAGGEIPFGQVYPSRYFEPGEVPAFHGSLAIQVDRNAEPITAIGFVGEYTVFFRRSHYYFLDGEGPDNISQGLWNTPRRAAPDIGAIGQESIAEIPLGLVFQSPAGIRVVTPGGAAAAIGTPVDSVAKTLDIASTLVVGADQEVRFYSWTGETLVYNYQYNAWSQWTVPAAGAVRSTETGLALVCTPTGTFLEEADDLWSDNGQTYRMRVRFSWLRAGALLDFQRVRRIGAIGSGTSHSIHVDVYFNERAFADEWFEWTVPDPDTQNEDTFGSGDFGDGNLGDNSSVAGISFLDSTWPWRRRLNRQKCSVISVAIDDNYTDGEGFTLIALALELGKKRGLDRTPWRGGTYTNTGGSGSSETGN